MSQELLSVSRSDSTDEGPWSEFSGQNCGGSCWYPPFKGVIGIYPGAQWVKAIQDVNPKPPHQKCFQ